MARYPAAPRSGVEPGFRPCRGLLGLRGAPIAKPWPEPWGGLWAQGLWALGLGAWWKGLGAECWPRELAGVGMQGIITAAAAAACRQGGLRKADTAQQDSTASAGLHWKSREPVHSQSRVCCVFRQVHTLNRYSSTLHVFCSAQNQARPVQHCILAHLLRAQSCRCLQLCNQSLQGWPSRWVTSTSTSTTSTSTRGTTSTT
jgi:hypothetical protein